MSAGGACRARPLPRLAFTAGELAELAELGRRERFVVLVSACLHRVGEALYELRPGRAWMDARRLAAEVNAADERGEPPFGAASSALATKLRRVADWANYGLAFGDFTGEPIDVSP